MDKKVYQEIEKLNFKECLKSLELIFNEKGLRNMLGYFTVGSMNDNLDTEEKKECKKYISMFRLAKKLVKNG